MTDYKKFAVKIAKVAGKQLNKLNASRLEIAVSKGKILKSLKDLR